MRYASKPNEEIIQSRAYRTRQKLINTVKSSNQYHTIQAVMSFNPLLPDISSEFKLNELCVYEARVM
ncbi:CLUMA_CG013855, isoform A [Clunio marinus]|uniref:CLUMA_CG013855, isoform A n=1 Tax=Clunio marinus TaxID=568069 RepID=A0A1J1IK36_9DIPT|nr:CLUMA_CG013855, isoform A [Clunio marinus]